MNSIKKNQAGGGNSRQINAPPALRPPSVDLSPTMRRSPSAGCSPILRILQRPIPRRRRTAMDAARIP